MVLCETTITQYEYEPTVPDPFPSPLQCVRFAVCLCECVVGDFDARVARERHRPRQRNTGKHKTFWKHLYLLGVLLVNVERSKYMEEKVVAYREAGKQTDR